MRPPKKNRSTQTLLRATRKTLAVTGIAAAVIGAPALAEDTSQDQLQQQLETLKAQLQRLQGQMDAAADQTGKPARPASVQSDTTIGGYGEASYNRYRADSSRNQADLKRFVLFFGHRFDEALSFNSEVEWEHAVTSASDKGETEIEQAYLNYNITPRVNLKTGLFLMPFGFINESHEPPTFYGVERNFVETRIIPSTWREGGVGLRGTTDAGLTWEAGLTTSFSVSKFDDPSAPLRATHQELQLAQAHDLALYGALNYRGTPGITVGGALFSGDSGQGNATFKADRTQPDFSDISARVTLWDVHARWQQSGWDLQALYAKGSIGDADRIDQTLQSFNAANPTAAPRPLVPSEFYGWLAQSAYTIWKSGAQSLAPFVRYEQFNTQSKMPSGFAANPANADRVTTVGISFKPHPQVVFKADYQAFKDNSNNDRFNLGVGYMF